jgi:hypothetical protein
MKRSTVAATVAVVLVTAASGAAAATGPSPETADAISAATSTAPAHSVAAFHLPAMDGVAHVHVRVPSRAAARGHEQSARERRAAHHNRPPALQPCPGTTPSPHFATRAAAMRYLARAWNQRNLDALCHVTAPDARRLLAYMHREAVHLRFVKCDYLTVGLYGCTFRHDYPRHLHQRGVGHAFLEVAAARTPGWYASGSVACG